MLVHNVSQTGNQNWLEKTVSQPNPQKANHSGPVETQALNKPSDIHDLRYLVIQRIVEKIFGQVFQLNDLALEDAEALASDAQDISSAQHVNRQSFSFSMEMEMEMSQQFDFEISVIDEQGQSQNVQVSVNMSMRLGFQFHAAAEQVSEQTLKDPLVINFEGGQVALADEKFAFDLDLDGQLDSLPVFASNSGYLALDKNQDQKINDGSELFGPLTNHGFNELRAYDQNQDYKIDSLDEIYKHLKIWIPDDSGGRLLNLSDQKIASINLDSQDSPVDLYNSRGLAGILRSTSELILQDNEASKNENRPNIQEIDLVI